LIRPSALGDVCRTVPVLASLRAAFPTARIDWLVDERYVPAIASHPAFRPQEADPGAEVGGPIPFPRTGMPVSRLVSPFSAGRVSRRLLRRLLDDLRARQADLAVDCQGLGRSGFFAFWSRAPVRVGYANAAEFAWLGLNHRVPVQRDMHTVDRMLALVESLGVPPIRDMRLYSDPQDRDSALRLDPRIADGPFIIVAPSSRWPGKRWPADRYAQVIEGLIAADAAAHIAVVAAPSERDQCGPILDLARRSPRVIDLCGRTSVGQLLALVERCAALLANDSAALHMAVGFNRPFVALFGPTRIELVGPYRRERDVIQAFPPPRGASHKDERIGLEMMKAIPVDRVLRAMLERVRPTA